MATNLQTLINNIPRAEDGHIITRQYHNSLRDAVEELARLINAGTGSGQSDTSITYSPVFLPITDGGVRSPEWVLSLGVASRPSDSNSARGWFPIQIPDDARIKSMTVTGVRNGSVLACQIRLMRQSLADATVIPIIVMNLRFVTGQPFKETREVTGASLPVIEDFKAVNNDRYQYLVQAELTNATSDALVDFYAVQIAFETAANNNNLLAMLPDQIIGTGTGGIVRNLPVR